MNRKDPRLASLFNPRSVCIVGASAKPGKLGYNILENIVKYGYTGKVYPVNPNYQNILGLPVYSNVSEIEDVIDLAVIVIPADAVVKVAEECGANHVKTLVVISAGFKEIGKEGAEREKALKDICEKYKMNLLGPNCLGVIDTFTPLNASFAAQMPIKGNIAFISQSGALGTAILDWSFKNRIGFSKVISLGNKAGLDESDFIAALAADANTRVILLYIEDIKDGVKFIKTLEKTVKIKPVLVLKSGSSAAGQRAAASHTGSLAGSKIAYETAFKQFGALQVETISDLFNYAKVFSTQPLPKDNSVCILTNAGGPGIIATDACEKYGLKLAQLSSETLNALRERLPSNASIYNPVDILGDAQPERYYKALEALKDDENISSIIIILTPQATTKPTETVVELLKLTDKIGKPTTFSIMGGEMVAEAKKILSENNIPVFSFPEDAVETISALVRYKLIRERKTPRRKFKVSADKETVNEIIRRVLSENRRTLLSSEACKILSLYGVKTPKVLLASNSEDACEAASEIGYPVTLKIASPDIIHKSDVGGVALNIKNEEDVRKTFIGMYANAHKLFPNARIYGVEVYEYVEKGREIIIGVNKDLQFGHLLMFGLGGVYVNFLRDVSFRVLPVNIHDVEEMIQETKVYNLLKGVRGEQPADIEETVKTILAVSQLVEDFPLISELDVNPLFVYNKGEGCIAVDVKMSLYT
ncbi:MAG: acetate--CoA ligase [Candidatus Odinarchaeum yellowstonii]|uniref:Acetate--CoA ligase n=1 Tax=Odinarchaeota yellowstonii (strain LCB_4) TaxID=1841599 RepID=A0AAF0D2H4_ODILC|nr:MAG: acetate--CoA ligase [Candidatus Odinarchaeum yellowstonii]